MTRTILKFNRSPPGMPHHFGMDWLKKVKADRGLDPVMHDFLNRVGQCGWILNGKMAKIELELD